MGTAHYMGLSTGAGSTSTGLRTLLAGLPLPRFGGGRLVLAVDVSPWLRSDAPCSAEWLFCHVYGRAKPVSQFIPGSPYSFVAVLELGATSWTSVLDVIRLGPEDDATAVTATLLRAVAERLVSAGQWVPGDPDIAIVMDAGYDVTRLAWVLRDLPIELVGAGRQRLGDATAQAHTREYAAIYPPGGRPAEARQGGDRVHPRLTHRLLGGDAEAPGLRLRGEG